MKKNQGSSKKGKRDETKGVEEGFNQKRVRLYKDELEVINNLRRIRNEAIENGLDPKDVKHGWIKNDNSSLFFKNPNFNNALDNQSKFTKDLLNSLKEHAPKYPTINRVKSKDGHLLVVDPADVHVGKLCTVFETGKDYNSQIAVQRCLDGVDGILNKSNGFNIDKIVFIGGNDILHVDNAKNTTTSGTYQDASGMWYENFMLAKQLYIDILEKLISIADVHFIFNPSNHDYTNGFFLAQVIEAYFKNCENITFNTTIAHRKGFKYFNNFIGTTHGDGAKMDLLPALFTQENVKIWSETKHRYIYTHHVHHKTSKDYIGVTIESLRSPSGTDSCHHRNGYEQAPKAVEGFLHSKENGQIARITHVF